MTSISDITDKRPIGVFDSGIGGLTVAGSIARRLPYERIVYYGDTAHLPYGEKSAKALRSYADSIAGFLQEQSCKAIVIACNSASAVAADGLRKSLGKSLPVVDVISPTARMAARKYPQGSIGVIATKATVNSRIYARRIARWAPDAKVRMLATPLLVAMIEEGFFNNNISKAVIADYLSRSNLRNIDALILGCTHFPLVKSEISGFLGDGIQVIDSTDVVADALTEVLRERKLLADAGGRLPTHRFFVSDLTPSFVQSTEIFFGKKLKLERKDLWA